MDPPIIVNISRLHRETSAVVRQAGDSDRPVFVTQFAFVVAVLLPRRMYDRLLRAADKGGTTAGPDRVASSSSPLDGPLAVFGPLPRGTRFQTRWGFSVDPQLAAFLMEDGEEVTPILRPEEQAALPATGTVSHARLNERTMPGAHGADEASSGASHESLGGGALTREQR
jgi:hypothetical protein